MRQTSAWFTATLDGNIPHKAHPGGFLMPVRLEFADKSKDDEITDMRRLKRPERFKNGEPVYAVPGGGKYLGN